jgi:hypothetical protein
VRGGGGRFSPAAMRALMTALMRLRICARTCVFVGLIGGECV